MKTVGHSGVANGLSATFKILSLICAAAVAQAQSVTNFVTGALWRETWFNVPGFEIVNLLSDWRFPNSPDQAGPVSRFEAPSNAAENYGVRLSGYITVPVSGSYIFYINANDKGVLMLSTNENPARKRVIARELAASEKPRDWITGANQGSRGNPPVNISAPINLITGRWYYVEALMKENCCTDNLGVTWRIPGGGPVSNGTAPIPGTYLAYGALPFGPSLLSAQTRGNPKSVIVTFDMPLDETSAVNPANFTIDQGVAINSVTLLEPAKIRLNTSAIAEGRVYTLTVNHVRNQSVPSTPSQRIPK